MALSAKTVRKQLSVLKPLLDACSIETSRRGQDKLGEIMGASRRGKVIYKEHGFEKFSGVWAIPNDERRQGVILYLHGGGYTSGGVRYAKGFAATLACECGNKVFAAAYRLAPENRFPAAVEDSLAAYMYLLDKGYPPEHIALCGESAGGGLCYALCLKLKEMGLSMPAAIITVSPWTDLTASGGSYTENRECDPTMTVQMLDRFATSYTDDRTDPLASPLFGELTGMPPSFIFVGGDEIMLDDATELHKKLCESGCISTITVKPERWHGYLLYNLTEDRDDFAQINRFLNRHMANEKKLRWFGLDNAAKIYPAARHRNWSNVFRLSVTLKEEVDKVVLQNALDVTARRFPAMAARLRRGLFWYYLEQLSAPPKVSEENSYPLAKMSKAETRRCAIRIIAYKNRIAVECFHSLTDGTGAITFLKTLTAEYLQQKYGVYIPSGNGVLGRLEEPSDEELEDSFLRCSGNTSASRGEKTAWHLRGTPEAGDFLNLTCFKVPVKAALDKAHEYNVSLTVFLCSVLMEALAGWQRELVPNIRKRKPIKVLIPVNLRPMFNSRSLRNFALYTTPEIEPCLGEYSFEEICKAVHHKMGLEVNAKHMSTKIATNVGDEKSLAVKLMPLFIKNAVMKAVFTAVGECKSCLSMSNLGAVKLPDEMVPFIERFDFILGVQSSAPHNCGVISFGDTLYINFIRNTVEAELESRFFTVLRDMGIPVTVESNYSSKEDSDVLY